MKKMISLIIIMLCNPSFATVYQWKDKNGVMHYSDSGSESGNNKKIIHRVSPANLISIPNIKTPNSHTKPTITVNPKLKISFSSLQDQETVRNNIGELTVAAALSSPIIKGQRIHLLVDGVIKKSQETLLFTLMSVPLGEHKLQLQLISQSGKVLALSQRITIYMHRFKAG